MVTTIDLTDEERDTLRETVERALSDLAVELAHTDSKEFKLILKQRQAQLNAVFEKLRLAPVVL